MSGLPPSESAPTAATPRSAEPPKNDTQEEWIKEFFDATNIVHTMQSLLRGGGRTVADLCKLCIAAHASDLVPALTPEGLMPFSNNYAYVFKYSDMNRKQIKSLVAVIDFMRVGDRMMRCVHENDFYIVPLHKNFIRIRDEVLLFGAATFMRQCLSQSLLRNDGTLVTHELPALELDRLMNAALFRIVNSCVLKRGALSECMRMLETPALPQALQPA
jgi:hypothetical protein